jgi:ribosomal protein S12 methylthiotransferase accessory factor YcaO
MTDEQMTKLMQAAPVAYDIATSGDRQGAIEFFAGQGAELDFAARMVDAFLESVAESFAKVERAKREAQRLETVAYNTRVLISEGWSPEIARYRAEAWG